jgi:hypothetical protein
MSANNTKFTPGPWGFWPSYTGEENTFEVGPDQYETVAHVRFGSDDVKGSCEDTARLIGAAPDLYAALEGLRQTISTKTKPDMSIPGWGEVVAALFIADSALAKAKGETP